MSDFEQLEALLQGADPDSLDVGDRDANFTELYEKMLRARNAAGVYGRCAAASLGGGIFFSPSVHGLAADASAGGVTER